MNKYLILFLFLAIGVFTWTGKAETIVADFESEGIILSYNDNGGCSLLSIMDNLYKTSLNSTNKVLYAVTTETALSGSDWWTGAEIDIKKDLTISALRADSNIVAQGIPINIDASTSYQTIEGFAASDCWMGNFVGQWNGANKAAIAKYLFSQNFDSNGNPEGIGLSMWRVNLGAGSYEQGDVTGNIGTSDPNYIMRRGESFLKNDIITSDNSSIDINSSSNYDWTKCTGQQYFMQQAKDYGCESFVAFSNSPLVIYTKNGRAYSGSASSSNMAVGNYTKYADYMTNVVKHFKDNGYNFAYISPVNEPQWAWTDPVQEGSPWTNSEIKSMVTALNTSITSKELSDTKIMLTEAGQWDYTYGQSGNANNQISQFFNSSSSNYVGNLTNVAKMIAGHSYWTDKTNSNIQSVRQNVKTNADTYGLRVFQTEWSMMEDSGIDGFPFNWSYIDVAINMAKIIYTDLFYANAASWSFWTAIDLERWSQKNRFILIRVRPDNNDYPTTYTQLMTEGSFTVQPNMWALGNYSLFVRPGYKRINLTGASDLAGLMATAYISPSDAPKQKIVAVFINADSLSKDISTEITGITGLEPTTYTVYETSASHSLNKTLAGNYNSLRFITIQGRSVVTIVFDLVAPTAIHTMKEISEPVISPNPVFAGGNITISLPKKAENNAALSLYSLEGNNVFNTKISAQIASIKLPAYLVKGVYLLKVQSGNQIYNNKVIVY